MMTVTETLTELREPTAALRKLLPGVYAGFSTLHDAAFAAGALTTKEKELVALGIAIVKGCDACIGYHTKTLAHLGATEQEVVEAIGVAILMDGGPSASGYGPKALGAFRESSGAKERAA
jgi:AhpD family alkylhydroperoxidase